MKELNLQGADSLAGKTDPWATVGLNLHSVEKKSAERSERRWNLGIRRTWPADFLSMTLNQGFPTTVRSELPGHLVQMQDPVGAGLHFQ